MRRPLPPLLVAAGCTVLVNNELDDKQPPPVGDCGVAADGSPCDTDGDPDTLELCNGGVCVPSFCGDGLVAFFAGEECDGTPGCNESCFLIMVECDEVTPCPNDENPCNGESVCRSGRCEPTDWPPDCSPCGDLREGRCVTGHCYPPPGPDEPLACYNPSIGGSGYCCGFECWQRDRCPIPGDP